MLRKTRPPNCMPPLPPLASMRPQRNAAENDRRRSAKISEYRASMRPQRNAAENHAVPVVDHAHDLRFNEAAA